jgi:hypothetical protein
MFKPKDVQNIKDDNFFEQWAKKLGKQIPLFWSDFVK